MTSKRERVRVEDIGREEAEVLTEDDVRKITGGATLADSFSTSINPTSAVTVRGWDPKEKKAIIGKDTSR